MEEWKTYKLSDVASFKTGKLDSNAAEPGGMYPFFTCSPETLRINDYAFDQRAIILAGNNAEGNFSIKYYEGKFNAYQRTYVISVNESIANIHFVYYALRLCLKRFKQMSQGTSTKFLTMSILNSFEIELPSIEKQNKIVNILLGLDSKIELNNHINHNLEEQAQALYKSWFVDFEPFKDGKFVESEFGMIPEGWSTISFRDFLTPVSRKIPVGIYPEYSVTNTGIIPRSEKFKKQLSGNSSLNKELRRYDIVFGMSREILNWGIMLDEVGSVSSAYNIYDINENVIHPLYLKYFIEHRIWYFNDLIGTAAREGQSLDKGALMQKYAIIPPLNVISSFMGKDKTYRDQILANESETTSLESLRDTILPKLMCGELNINEIDC